MFLIALKRLDDFRAELNLEKSMNESVCFISYASEDLPVAQALYRRLREAGLNAWMDKPPSPYRLEGLKPGELWEDRLRETINNSKYFLPLFSKQSVQKVGYVQSEFRQALTKLALVPAGQTYVLPVRIEDCQIPKMRIDGISFAQYQYIDCYNANFSELVAFISSLEGGVMEEAEYREVTVNSADEFLSCISSNTTISIKQSFSLSGVEITSNRHVYAREVFGGEELVFRDLENLRIIGAEGIRVTVEPAYATTMNFENCHSVEIENISAGHWPERGDCTGAVMKFNQCSSITVRDCKIFGSGTYGFEAENSQFVQFQNCDIYQCSYGIFTAKETSSLRLVDVKFYDNLCFDAFTIDQSDVWFEKCKILNNRPRSDHSSIFKAYRSQISFTQTRLEIGAFTKLGLTREHPGLTLLNPPDEGIQS